MADDVLAARLAGLSPAKLALLERLLSNRGDVTDDGLAGYLEYAAALLDRSAAVTLARDFVEVLEAVIASPDRPLTERPPVRRSRACGKSTAIG